MADLHEIAGSGKRAYDATGEMAWRIKDVIYEYAGIVPTASAIGVLAIVQAEIIQEQADTA